METARLKIKFTSLIKKLRQSDSKCYLEIVPEVTCLKNVEKMLWKQENNLYEYVIPITYKIIFKKCQKHNTTYNIGHKLNQIYYSCVDMLRTTPTSSLATIDIQRTFSETLLLKEISPSVHKWEISPRQLNKCNFEQQEELIGSGNNNADRDYNISYERNQRCCVMHNNHVQVDLNNMTIVENVVKKGTEKYSNKEIDYSSNGIASKRNIDEKGKLSLTPVCFIDTNDSIVAENNYNKTVAHSTDVVVYDYKTPLLKTNIEAKYMPSYDFQLLKSYRNTTQMRIANLIKLMEYEMLPLKCMLNDIIRKYASLNIDQLKKSFLVKKKVKIVENSENQNSHISNRVIYTIVFDG